MNCVPKLKTAATAFNSVSLMLNIVLYLIDKAILLVVSKPRG
jgi:hypothetical protein